MYFDKSGKVNTQRTLEPARQQGRELGLDEVAPASSPGETACQALKIFVGFQIICKPRDFG